ncbi:LysR family transcriptional regulator [Leisingera sp. McT4-56]|uniref:LysR family transcriptional regulator n=1 Tax=Leisingera sp. McT4-56 TaxID=2881255 RepID=UPI001CF88ECF|nr:LysR family transcriptional regulator [Leisingera sp. McT4-56]MCB4458546.1 LysR family transcriptional regulator [Leisingera sp. McT4-56]
MLSLHENSIRKLRVFVTVVDCGGFAAAQSVLNMSAATISIQMKELEEQLGMTLCQRGRSGFRITDQGTAVYEAAQTVLGAFSNFNLAAAEIQNRLVGEVKIGLQANMATNPAFRLPEAVRKFQTRPNKVTFRLEETRSADQQSRTLDGRYDLSIGLFPARIPGLDYTRLFTERVALYCACAHPLSEITDESRLLQEIGSHAMVSSGTALEQVLKKPPALPSPSVFTEDMDAAMLFVLSGQYLGFLPTHFAQIWEDKEMVCPILPGRFATDLEFHLITRRGGRDNKVVDVFISDLLDAHSAA